MRRSIAYFVALCFVLMIALAGTSYADRPQLTVLEVRADLDAGVLYINGVNFYWTGDEDLTVLLSDQQLSVNSSSDTEIEAVLPGGITSGSYLLTVSRGFGAVQWDEYEVAIGAVGPEGPPGPTANFGCGTLVISSSCPGYNNDGPNCDDVLPGSFCEGDGECGTDSDLDNCGPYDWYFKTQL